MTPFQPPANYPRVKVVASFDELVSTPFSNGVNALCWQRALMGDFDEVVARLGDGDGIASLEDASLRAFALTLSAEGKVAVETLIADLQLLREHGLDPVLDCIHRYSRDEPSEIVATDVYSFHADSATVEADTYLCTYAGSASEGLRNEEARRRVDIPATRAELLRQFGGEEGGDFLEYLRECCYDLHYAAMPGALPFSFGVGNLWRIAIQYPGCPVPPCVHRAPETILGRPPRLLLIS